MMMMIVMMPLNARPPILQVRRKAETAQAEAALAKEERDGLRTKVVYALGCRTRTGDEGWWKCESTLCSIGDGGLVGQARRRRRRLRASHLHRGVVLGS